MARSTFEYDRGGIRHRYEAREDGFHYIGGTTTQKELLVPWSEFANIIPGRAQSVYFVKKNKQKIGVWLEPDDLREFLKQAVVAWGKKDRDTARKVAFDYGATEPAVGWIWLVLSLAFPGLLAAVLLSDGFHTLKCNRLLAPGQGQVAQANLLKVKKNRRGNFIWQLEFNTRDGQTVTGVREAPITEENGSPKEPRPTIVYSPAEPKCWDLSLRPGENALNGKQRHFVLLMDMCFGWAFAIVAAIATWFSMLRILRRKPGFEAVRIAGQAIT